ncbi:hypothetical protein Dxin01_00138 [Deinococcus xinjiangensis]|uniref:Uncharacterized protein n=1 Tax=Deinococcus xinjiangensis TaxID=457454 RepID=A0ABP9V565_9DEIO
MSLSERRTGIAAFSAEFEPVYSSRNGDHTGLPKVLEDALEVVETRTYDNCADIPILDGWQFLSTYPEAPDYFDEEVPEDILLMSESIFHSICTLRHELGDIYIVAAGPAELDPRWYQVLGNNLDVLRKFAQDFVPDQYPTMNFEVGVTVESWL